MHMNDIVAYDFTGFSPADHERQMRDEFDQLYEEGADRRRMMLISLHARLSGHASRVRVLDRFLSYAKTHPDVWFARKDEIAPARACYARHHASGGARGSQGQRPCRSLALKLRGSFSSACELFLRWGTALKVSMFAFVVSIVGRPRHRRVRSGWCSGQRTYLQPLNRRRNPRRIPCRGWCWCSFSRASAGVSESSPMFAF
jgi:hypothetical protein